MVALTLVLALTAQKPIPPTPASQAKKAGAKPLSSGEHSETIDESGTKRTYIARVPTGFDGKHKLPLVILLHPWTSSAKGVEVYTGMDKESDKDGFMLVLPDGLGKLQGWNVGFLSLGGKDADDVKFLTDVLADVEKKALVDLRRVYFVGHSDGGMMAYLMGSKLASKVAAIGVVGGTIGFDSGPREGTVPAPSSPVSAIIIHGRLDPNVPYDHGQGLLMNCYSAPASAAFWAKADGITTPPSITTAAKGNLELHDWKEGKIEVELMAIANGTHDWPGGTGWDGPETKTGIKASAQIWGFLKAHPKQNT
jgi:polyhydroxybutyrate depolymerase